MSNFINFNGNLRTLHLINALNLPDPSVKLACDKRLCTYTLAWCKWPIAGVIEPVYELINAELSAQQEGEQR